MQDNQPLSFLRVYKGMRHIASLLTNKQAGVVEEDCQLRCLHGHGLRRPSRQGVWEW